MTCRIFVFTFFGPRNFFNWIFGPPPKKFLGNIALKCSKINLILNFFFYRRNPPWAFLPIKCQHRKLQFIIQQLVTISKSLLSTSGNPESCRPIQKPTDRIARPFKSSTHLLKFIVQQRLKSAKRHVSKFDRTHFSRFEWKFDRKHSRKSFRLKSELGNDSLGKRWSSSSFKFF